MLSYRFYRGSRIPHACRSLTLTFGLMKIWFDHCRDKMAATVLTDGDTYIAWCGYHQVSEKTFEIGTYVRADYRKKDYGTECLNRALKMLAKDHPGATVRYGANLERFNEKYHELIKENGLVPDRWFA